MVTTVYLAFAFHVVFPQVNIILIVSVYKQICMILVSWSQVLGGTMFVTQAISHLDKNLIKASQKTYKENQKYVMKCKNKQLLSIRLLRTTIC